MFLFLLLIFIISIILGLIIYARWHFGVFERMGIPVDKPHFILGNIHDLYAKPVGYGDIERYKRLGPIFGLYEGREPQLFITDPDLIRLITSKNSECFNDKRRMEFKNDMLNEMLAFQPYGKWKALREILTPMLSVSKVKMMSKSMLITLDNFAKDVQNKIENSPGKKLEQFDLRDGVLVMIMNMITRIFFSVEVENPSDPNNHFATIVRAILSPDSVPHSKTLEIWSSLFPILQRFGPKLSNAKGCKEFEQVFSQMIKTRRQSGENKKDVVDLGIELMDKLDSPEFKKLKITKQTIFTQAFIFFLWGQDQIASTPAIMIYEMLKNPEIEKNLYDEVDNFLQKHDGKVKHEDLPELQYLLATLTETIRLFPLFARMERVCTKDWKNEEFNLHIKKGMVIQIPIWVTNRNPKYFPNPDEFQPTRFLPENKEQLHPFVFSSFGHGPRNCPGIKLSYEQLLLTSFTLLRNFKFHLRDDSKPVYVPCGPFFAAHMPFYFDVTKRNN